MAPLQNRDLLKLPQSRSPEYKLNAASAFLKYEEKIEVKEEHMDHRVASHFVPKNDSQGVSNVHGTSTEAHSAMQILSGINDEAQKMKASAEIGLHNENFFCGPTTKSFIAKSFDIVMVAPETQKPEEPDSVPSEKGDDGTQKASSHYTAYFSCKDANSSEPKSMNDRVVIKGS
jgi:hypothetical protein